MAITVLGARRRLHRVGLGGCLPEERFEQLLGAGGHKWRERLLTPVVFLRLFVLQMLHANVAINALRQMSGMDFSDTAYVNARKRAPLWSLSQLMRELVLGAIADDTKWRRGQAPQRTRDGCMSSTDRASASRTRRRCTGGSACRRTRRRAWGIRRRASLA